MKTNVQNASPKALFASLVALALTLTLFSQIQPPPAGLAVVEPEPGNLRAFIEMIRSDIRTEKALVIARHITFTEAESAEFWPLQREYELERNKLLDQRLGLINEYLGMHNTMTDEQASKLADRAFSLEEKQTDLKRTYFKKFSRVIPAKKAAQFFQLENQINAAVDVRLAASLPLIK